ncbi:MAG: hypothetical protein Q8P88_00800 [Candidatus Jorgensenbacteria bacterium]|nr:hypothetical protein [Candidatus Jorgensenbacteria bacterium]
MTLTYLVVTFGLTAGFFIWLIIYLFVMHQDKGERLVGWFTKFFAWTGKGVQKTSDAMSIQGKVDSFINSINTEVEDLLPYGLKIKWISPEMNKETFIEKNKVIVMLSYHSNKDENLSKVALLYMNKAVIPEARPHIYTKLGRAIDLMMTKKALYSFVEARSSFGYFIDFVLRPEIESDPELKEFCQIIDVTDEHGLFTRVMLRELLELGRRRAGVTETGESVLESNNFTKFLNQIAQKESGQDVPLTFIGHDIRTSVILVARSANSFALDNFLKRIRLNIKNSVNVIYVFARGAHIPLAKEVVNNCSLMPELAKIHEEEFPVKNYTGDIVNGFCAIFFNRKLSQSKRTNNPS